MDETASRTALFRAAVWMLGTVVSFTLMAVAGRELAHTMTTFEILFFRSLFGILVLAGLISMQPGGSIATGRFKTHLARNLTHFIGQYAWIYGIAWISLAEVFAIEATAPVWTAIVAAVLLGETLTRARMLAILLGFSGVLLVLRPGFAIIHPASLVVLLGALGYGFAYVMTRTLASTESPVTVLFYMCAIQLPLAGVPTLFEWVTPVNIQWLWLGVIGATALTGHYCITRAMQLADAALVVPMDFLRLPLIAVVGFLLYHEEVDWLLLVGALLIFVGNYLNIRSGRSEAVSPKAVV